MSPLHHLLSAAHDDPLAPGGRHLGVEVGIVSDNQDPEGLGRVRVVFPRLPGDPESDWLRVATPAAGRNSGFYWLPAVDEEVLLAFERGDPSCGYVIGSLWNGSQPPPAATPKSANSPSSSTSPSNSPPLPTTQLEVRSRSGNRLVLNDGEGKEELSLHDCSGKLSITFDAVAKVLRVQALEGDLELLAPSGSVRMKGKAVEIESADALALRAGNGLEIKAQGSAKLGAGPALSLRARRINLN